MPKVSIIIPVYNAEKYLERCLDSVCNQTLKDIEIICVNDCSTDNSLEILNSYAKKYSNLKVIDCKNNGGESVARNIGLDNASGEYLAFVDNDDIVDLDFYEKLYQKASETDADIVKGEAKETDYNGQTIIRSINKKIRENNCKAYFAGDWWTAIYKNELINSNKIRFPEGVPLGGDVLFVNKAVIAANAVSTVDGTYYNHILREDSGDSKYCTFEKIKSVVNIFLEIIDNTNNTSLDNIKPEGYDYIFKAHLIELFMRAYRSNEAISKSLCAEAIIKIYNLCYRKEQLYNCIKNESCDFLLPFLKDNDKEGLANFFINYSTLDKIRIKLLRDSIKNKLAKQK